MGGPGMFPMGGANPMFYQAQANGMGGRGGGFGYPQVSGGINFWKKRVVDGMQLCTLPKSCLCRHARSLPQCCTLYSVDCTHSLTRR